MEMWSEIRRAVLTGVLSQRAALAKYGIGWRTLKKMLAHDEPPGYRQSKQRPRDRAHRHPDGQGHDPASGELHRES